LVIPRSQLGRKPSSRVGLRGSNPVYDPSKAQLIDPEITKSRRALVRLFYYQGLRAYAIANRILKDPKTAYFLAHTKHPVNTVEWDIKYVKKSDGQQVSVATVNEALAEYCSREDLLFLESIQRFEATSTVAEFTTLVEHAQTAARNKARVLGVNLDGPVIDHKDGDEGRQPNQFGPNINIFGSPEAWLAHLQAIRRVQEELDGSSRPALESGAVPADERDSLEGA